MMLAALDTEFDGHDAHSESPDPAVYLPAEHSEHTSMSVPIYPALHSHAVLLMLAATETEFNGQDVQKTGPNSDLYVSIKHS